MYGCRSWERRRREQSFRWKDYFFCDLKKKQKEGGGKEGKGETNVITRSALTE